MYFFFDFGISFCICLPSIGFFSVSSADTNEEMATAATEIDNVDMTIYCSGNRVVKCVYLSVDQNYLEAANKKRLN